MHNCVEVRECGGFLLGAFDNLGFFDFLGGFAGGSANRLFNSASSFRVAFPLLLRFECIFFAIFADSRETFFHCFRASSASLFSFFRISCSIIAFILSRQVKCFAGAPPLFCSPGSIFDTRLKEFTLRDAVDLELQRGPKSNCSRPLHFSELW